ncbi:MAG: hypothetical protein KAT65_25260 [Methanophagales archaeon]|nr:hypothetical protein [Methanophagales archaeon]
MALEIDPTIEIITRTKQNHVFLYACYKCKMSSETMATIRIQKEAVPIIKSGLAIEENLLKMSLDEYGKDLAILEKKYKMSRKDFIQKFESGELGDDAEWFEFLFAYRAFEHVKKKLKLIEEILI